MTLLEAMAAELPIVCSNRGPMPEVMGEAALYCDPEDAADIARAIRELIEVPALRAEKSAAAASRADDFSWPRCAGDTFRFLAACCHHRVPGGTA